MVVTPPSYYGNTNDVIHDSGIKPADLGFKDITNGATGEEQLTAKVEAWLIEAKALIDSNRKRNFTEEYSEGTLTEIPVCIHSIARRLAVNMAKQAMLNHSSPVIKVDEYTVKITDSNIFTADIKSDLQYCMRKKTRYSITTL